MSHIRPPSFAHYREPLKRKRTRSVSSRPSSSAGFSSSPGPPPSNGTINPLSYTPTVLSQLHLAGHSDADLLPSTAVPNFPHRPLPREKHRGGRPAAAVSSPETNDEDEGEEARGKDAKRRQNAEHAHRVAERHLGVLAALIHRSLEEGDIARAKRAFGLLVRSDIWGASVDLRKNGYWALGAEILMREGEKPPSSGDEEVGEDEARRSEDGVDKEESIPCRWGRASNMPMVRDYFRSLISQYPWNRFHPRSMSALSFWPALLGCELYNTWIEQVRALRRFDIEAEEWSYIAANDESDLVGVVNEEGHGGDSAYLKLERRKREARDAIRLEALGQMRDVARLMDDLMIAPPFSTSHELLRLRGMIALYMADLVVPPRPRTESEEHEARVQRGTEMDRARHRFRKIIEDGGEVERWVGDFVSRSTDDDDEEDQEDRSSNIDLPYFSSLPIRGR